MKRKRAIAMAAQRPRFRGTITSIMLIMLSVMIVRDILVRRWSTPAPASDVTRRLP